MSALPIEYSEKSQADLLGLVDWLDSQSESLGDRFRTAVQATVVDLAKEPGMGVLYECDMRVLEGMRKKGVDGFLNYLIFYRVEGRMLRILRVLDGRRDLPKVIAWELNEAAAPYGSGEPAECPDYGPPPGMFSITAETTQAQLEEELLKGLNSPVGWRGTVDQLPAYTAARKAELLAKYAPKA